MAGRAFFTECVRVQAKDLTAGQVGELRRWDGAPEHPFVAGSSGNGKWTSYYWPEDAPMVKAKLEEMGVTCE